MKGKKLEYAADIIRAAVHGLIAIAAVVLIVTGTIHTTGTEANALLIALAAGSNSLLTGAKVKGKREQE